MAFILYPALDILSHQVVRLRQGKYDEVTVYSTEPVALAAGYEAAGATHLHVVDLGAAKAGEYSLAETLNALTTHTNLQVQTGGGIRSEADIERALGAGAARVVIGSVAVKQPELVQHWLALYGAERIVIALDVRPGSSGAWHPATDGWTQNSTQDAFALAQQYGAAGAKHILLTDITKDGMLTGINTTLYEQLCAAVPGLAVQASGGVRAVSDIPAARAAGCGGIVLGKALLEGRFTIAEALAV